ncbi:MAG: acetyl-CoA carboxylase biotin carboxyl carrier protein subunit [Candidatus Zixiibacteriota bacterium]
MARYLVDVGGHEYDIKMDKTADGIVASVNGRSVNLVRFAIGSQRSLLLVDGNSYEVDVRTNGTSGTLVFIKGTELKVHIEDYRLSQLRKASGMPAVSPIKRTLVAPMPGLIVEVKVAVGDAVTANQPLAVIEAMKMENVLKAPADGSVCAVHVESGQSVEKGDTLVEFE